MAQIGFYQGLASLPSIRAGSWMGEPPMSQPTPFAEPKGGYASEESRFMA
jgi:hypothetical protein